jgi:hypothetical protein
MNKNLYIAASASSPEVDFRFDAHRLSLRGESYPENAAAYYGPIIQSLRDYIATLDAGNEVSVDVAMSYFNSSSTKMLFTLFDLLNAAAADGRQIALNWHFDVDDETMLEFGQELRDDFPALKFNSLPVES